MASRIKIIQRLPSGEARDDWQTPLSVFAPIADALGVNLDVCASEFNAQSPLFFNESDDGLLMPWSGVVWCNPPYSSWGEWAKKAEREAKAGTVVVFLVPPRTDSKAWHSFTRTASHIIFLESRIPFLVEGKPRSGNPAPSVLIIWDFFKRKAREIEQLGAPGPQTRYWSWKNKSKEGSQCR